VKRLLVTLTAAATIALGVTGPAFADSGAPGTTFPEQPGGHPQTACGAIATNPGLGLVKASPTALAILTPLYSDACLGG
jgi:hypothetical protein